MLCEDCLFFIGLTYLRFAVHRLLSTNTLLRMYSCFGACWHRPKRVYTLELPKPPYTHTARHRAKPRQQRTRSISGDSDYGSVELKLTSEQKPHEPSVTKSRSDTSSKHAHSSLERISQTRGSKEEENSDGESESDSDSDGGEFEEVQLNRNQLEQYVAPNLCKRESVTRRETEHKLKSHTTHFRLNTTINSKPAPLPVIRKSFSYAARTTTTSDSKEHQNPFDVLFQCQDSDYYNALCAIVESRKAEYFGKMAGEIEIHLQR
jgi:hypothetical protein